MGEGDDMERSPNHSVSTWVIPTLSEQAVAIMDDCHLQPPNWKKNVHAVHDANGHADSKESSRAAEEERIGLIQNGSVSLAKSTTENLRVNDVSVHRDSDLHHLNNKISGSPIEDKKTETTNDYFPTRIITAVAKTNGLAKSELNANPPILENTTTQMNGRVKDLESKDEFIKNGLVDIYKNGIVEGLAVPHGDVRKTIRANMMGVQPNFKHYTWEIKWGHVFMIGFVHAWALLAIPSLPYMKWQTFLLRLFETAVAGIGVTAGAHRLYCHRAYKATLPLHLFLLWAYSVAGQNTLFDWVRDHRVHHKFSETDADPHNANRGWFFSHCGWLLVRKHPEVLRRGKTVDMSDITGDPYIATHTKIFYVLKTFTCHIIPILMPMMLWDEGFWVSANSMIIRFVVSLNATWSVNSFAHLWGDRPIDKRIFPGENWLVAIVAFGEGWHNYHHVFPWDYKAAEWGPGIFNIATGFLDFCAYLGLAYDLKEPSQDLIRRTALRHGDGTWSGSYHTLDEVPEPSVSKDHAKAC